jgi:diguanylate cyclase (GGDEF)-like protein/PAS domain S-box-containing protein
MRSLHDPEMLQRFVAELGLGIYVTNESGEILDANPALLELLGLPSIDGRRAQELFVEPTAREQQVDVLRREGALRDYELQLRRADGSLVTVSDTVYAVRDAADGQTLFHGALLDVTERNRQRDQLRELSVRDPLTGCFNRRRIAELEPVLRQRGAIWGAIVIDIDGFKRYNDEHGHDAGDEVLVRVSRFLSQTVRGEDTVIRVGGDEFVIVVAGAIRDATDIVASRLQLRAQTACPVPFSFGWAVQEESETLEETIARADKRLIQVRLRERHHERRNMASQRFSLVPAAPTGESAIVPANSILDELRRERRR